MHIIRWCTAVAALSILLSAIAAVSRADTASPLGGGVKNPARATLVEQPHEAVKLWSDEGLHGATLLLISPVLGMNAINDTDAASALRLIKARDFEGLLSKDYPTARVYPVNPSNYISAAHAAGLIDKVYWVPPTKMSLGEEPLSDFRKFLGGLGIKQGDLDGLKQDKVSIQGRLEGVQVYIGSLRDLPDIDGEVVVMVDLAFISSFYENEVKTPYLDLFGGFLAEMGGKSIMVSEVVVSRSTALGPVPLGQRFGGGYLRAYFTSPDGLKDGPPQAWQLRSQGMYAETFSQTDDALKSYREAVEAAPDDASLRYDLARVYSLMNNMDRLKDELGKAVAGDKGYYPAYMDYARRLDSDGMHEAAESLLKEAVKANPDDPRCWDTLYSHYFANGKYQEAADAATKLIVLGFDWPSNMAFLAAAYRKQGMFDKALKTYDDALRKIPPVEKDARMNMLMDIASTYEEGGKLENALAVYRDALGYATDPQSRRQVQERIDEAKKGRTTGPANVTVQ